jgi:hypothetical protein
MSPGEELYDLNENLAHARASYANAQDVIKFVDTKTGILTGVLTITTGIPLAVFHFIISHKSDEATTINYWLHESGCVARILLYVSAIAMCVGFTFGVISLLAATSGLMARRPRTAKHKEDPLWREIMRAVLHGITFGKIGTRASSEPQPELTCLFPLFPPERREEAVANFRKLAAGKYRTEDILREYTVQLESVGSVLGTKISRNRKAVRFFEGQLAAYVLSSILSVILVFAYPYQPTDKDQWNLAARGHARKALKHASPS